MKFRLASLTAFKLKLMKPQTALALGFELTIITIPLSKILPRQMLKEGSERPNKYYAVLNSVKKSGLVEPLVVYPNEDGKNYILLDGHWRYFALQEIEQHSVECLIANSDEGFTYNHYVNRLSVIQEQKMILKAIDQGVSENEIAKALNVDVKRIRAKKNLLKGISKEVAELLKEKRISESTLLIMKKVIPSRQLEMAELMISLNTYNATYAKALLASTPDDQLIKKPQKKFDDIPAKMELEMQHLEKAYLQAEENYGSNMCDLTLALSYLKRLMKNSKIVTYLSKNHHDIFLKYEELAQQESL